MYYTSRNLKISFLSCTETVTIQNKGIGKNNEEVHKEVPFSFIYLIKANKIRPIEVNFGHKETTNGFKAQMKDELKLINILCKIVSSQQYFITV